MKKTFIIAEAGVNHNGDIDMAKRLIDAAADAGADAVKFQTFKAEKLVCKDARKADYQLDTTNASESQYEMLKTLELSYDKHLELIEYCIQKSIMFLSTPFDVESMEFLVKLGVSIIKIPSGEITNYPYLVSAAKTGLPIILSTGMSNMEEIEDALNTIKFHNGGQVSLLHCNTEYPTPMKDVNLRAIETIKSTFSVPVGYSDHTVGIETPIAAVTLGAEIIEKHFTLDKTMDGPDHKASLEPAELKAMVQAIRNVEIALGNGIKKASDSEKRNISVVRKSIVAAKDIKKGEIYTEDNITTKRPGTGISPMRWESLIGEIAQKDYSKDTLIEEC